VTKNELLEMINEVDKEGRKSATKMTLVQWGDDQITW